MKTILKSTLIIAATLVVAACIVFFSALFWIKSSYGLQWVQSRINTEIPGKIIVGSHQLSLLKPTIDLYGVVLQDPQGVALAGFTHLSVGLDWRALWRREILLNHIQLQGPWVDLAVDKATGSNLLTALVAPVNETETEPPTDSAELPFNIVLASIKLTDGRFTYAPSDDSMRLEASGLTLLANGNLKNQSGSLELALDGLRFSNADIQPQPARILLRADLNGDTLTVPALNVTSGQTTLSLSGTADGLYGTPVVDSVLSLDSQLNELKSVFDLTGDYSGNVKANLTVKGSVANPDARLVLSVAHGLISGQPIDSSEMVLDLKDRLAKIDTAALRLDEGSVNLDGTINLRDAFPEGFLAPPKDINAIDYALSLVHDIPDLNRWLKPFVDITGATTGRVSLTGNGVMPSAISAKLTLEGTGQKLLVPGMDRSVDADVNVSAQMDGGIISISRLSAVSDGVELSGDGRFQMGDEAITAKLSLTAGDLSRVLAVVGIPSVNGSCSAKMTVDGSLKRPQFSLDLASKNLKVETYSLGDLVIQANMGPDGRLNLTTLGLQYRGSMMEGNGSIQILDPATLLLTEDPSLDFTVNSDHFDPADFTDVASGNFSFTGVLSGSLEKPIGKITLAGSQIKLAGQSLESLSLDARVKDRRMMLDQLLAVFAPGEQIEAGGSVGMDKSIDLHLKSDGISLSRIEQLQDIFPVEGVLRLDATGKGNMENPDVEGKLSISGVIINDEAMEDVNLTYSLHDMLAKVKGKLNFALDAACDLKKGGFDAQLLFDRTETAAYFMAAGQSDLHGTLTGQVKAAGNIHDADNVSVQLDLNAFQVFYDDISLARSDQIKLKMDNRELSIEKFELELLSSGNLRVQGDVGIGGQMNIEIDGRIPVAAAEVFSDELADSTGVLAVKGAITGDTADPQIDARINLENIGMTVPGLVQKLHDLNGRIHVTTDDVSIEAIKGFLDTGSFSIDGTIAHEKFTPTKVNLAVGAKALPLEFADTMSLLLNGDIVITGNDRTAVARGEIVLLEGVYFKDVKINLLQIVTSRERTVAPETTPLSLPYFDTVDLDIAIKNRQPLLVQNNLAQLEISPDLKLGGTLARPVVSGRAQVSTGTITFQKKTFAVKKGIIDFVNPYKTEAAIDIESETTIRTWTITLAIKGTPDNLDLKLSSVPTESDSDILSLILFGRTGRELAGGEGGQKRSTNQMIAEMIADTIGEDIKKSTGVDILQLETIDSGDSQDAAGVKVTVGKHLSDRMTVKYAVESKDGEVIQRAITEYKLLENILVSGFQDNLGIFGAELVFRIEFR